MKVKIQDSWHRALQSEFDKDYFVTLTDFVKQEYATKTVFPPASKIFGAFDSCALDDLKVVILGQDPYHGYGQAHGMCFSVCDGVTFPPSLRNIFKEIQQDLGTAVPASGNLSRWAKQGVFLLNSTLTVLEAQATSHQGRGWETFTDNVIELISREKSGVVFMLWGGYAKSKQRLIDSSKHLILTANHPSPLSANRGGWFGTKHFSKANKYLSENNKTLIDW